MTQCPICGQELSEQSSRCESCERWAAGVDPPPANALDDLRLTESFLADAPVSAALSADVVIADDVAPPPADAAERDASPVVAAKTAAAATPQRRHLMWVLVAIVATATVTLAALMTRTESPSNVAAAAAPPSTTPTRPPAAAKPAPVRKTTQHWTSVNRARWLADTPGTVAFDLAAEETVPIWMRRVRPALVVRCASGKIEAFVFTDSALAIEPQTEDHTVTFAIDDEAGRTERWTDSQDHDALFVPDGRSFAERLVHARLLRVGYTPHNAAPVTAHFAVAGLSELMASAARPCGWKK